MNLHIPCHLAQLVVSFSITCCAKRSTTFARTRSLFSRFSSPQFRWLQIAFLESKFSRGQGSAKSEPVSDMMDDFLYGNDADPSSSSVSSISLSTDTHVPSLFLIQLPSILPAVFRQRAAVKVEGSSSSATSSASASAAAPQQQQPQQTDESIRGLPEGVLGKLLLCMSLQ